MCASLTRRTVALPPEVFEPLVEHLDRFVMSEPSAWCFTGDKGGPLRDDVWQHEWVRARDSVGLPDLHLPDLHFHDLRFHDLRRVAATLAAETGARKVTLGSRRRRDPGATTVEVP